MALFDPARYAGTWHEIARFPVPFQDGCRSATATYTMRADGTLAVMNRCDTGQGTREIAGNVEIVGPGRLKLRLNGMRFAADYWVLWVDDDYRTAVVGHPSGRAGWILARSPRISPDRLWAARRVLEFNGYDTERLTLGPEAPA